MSLLTLSVRLHLVGVIVNRPYSFLKKES